MNNESLESGDSQLLLDATQDVTFDDIKSEVTWNEMFH
jgi:hypothetical protein